MVGGGAQVVVANILAQPLKVLAPHLRGVRRIMNGHGDWRARIWLTELGWGDSGPRHRFVVGARGQAKLIGGSRACGGAVRVDGASRPRSRGRRDRPRAT
jgi:hypothetical protein